MDYRKGKGIVALKNAIVSGIGKLIVYVEGEVTIDLMNNKSEAMVEIKNISTIEGMKRATIPMSNVSGIVWHSTNKGHS